MSKTHLLFLITFTLSVLLLLISCNTKSTTDINETSTGDYLQPIHLDGDSGRYIGIHDIWHYSEEEILDFATEDIQNSSLTKGEYSISSAVYPINPEDMICYDEIRFVTKEDHIEALFYVNSHNHGLLHVNSGDLNRTTLYLQYDLTKKYALIERYASFLLIADDNSVFSAVNSQPLIINNTDALFTAYSYNNVFDWTILKKENADFTINKP